MIPRLSRVVDKQQSADLEPGLARRFGFMSAVTFTLSMLALDVTETVAVVRKIDNDPLSVGVSILIPLAFVAMSPQSRPRPLRRGGCGLKSADGVRPVRDVHAPPAP